jgi:proteasome component ECM29
LIVKANSTHAKDVNLTTFNSLQGLFERVPADITSGLDEKATLEKLLFDQTFEGLPEAMRQKRAEALVALAKIKGTEWVVERIRPEIEGGERSPQVRGTLEKVGKK